jgi:FkbM family methyltransferase
MASVRFVPRRAASRLLQVLALLLRTCLPGKILRGIRRHAVQHSKHTLSYVLAHALAGLLRFAGIPPVVDTFTVVEEGYVARLVRCDSQIAARLYWFGSDGWEPELIPYWRLACRAASRITELGANIGYFSVMGGLAASGQYFAVEPHPVSAGVLRQNIVVNGLSHTVHAIEAAASPYGRHQVRLNVPAVDHYATPAGAFVDPNDQPRKNGAWMLVETIPIAELLEGSDLVKMDVEGMEAVLIEASRTQLLAYLPTVFLEYLDSNADLREVVSELLATSDYRALVPVAGGLAELAVEDVRTVLLQRAYGTRDLILTTDPNLTSLV